MGTPIFTGDVFQWARFCNETFDNIGSKEIERLITGTSKSPDLRIGITFVIFHDRTKEPVANDLLNKLVIIGSDTGRRTLRTLEVILSIPGALFLGRP